MRGVGVVCAMGLVMASFAQEKNKTQVLKLDGINVFVKCQPISNYEVVEEIKASGMLKSSKTQAELIGAAGFKKITYAIQEMNDLNLKAAKKGKQREFDGAMIVKPNVVQIIKLESETMGLQGADANVQVEKKTGKLIFYASQPYEEYEVVSEISYNQGGLGETMRGGNSMDVAINGMLDKAVRWVKRGKIESDFDALIVDWRALRMGKVSGELIKFK